MSKLPVIAGVEITTDTEGRFNLNTLHRASGTGESKEPNKWLALKSTAELLAELEATAESFGSAINVTKGGNAPGTFAHELLAISYAGWISPKFQLEVNQVFLNYRTGGHSITPTPPAPYEQNIAYFAFLREQMCQVPGVNPAIAMASMLACVEQVTGIPTEPFRLALPIKEAPLAAVNPTQLGKPLGLSGQAVNKRLQSLGLQFKNERGEWELTEAGMKYGEMHPYARNGHAGYQPLWRAEAEELLK